MPSGRTLRVQQASVVAEGTGALAWPSASVTCRWLRQHAPDMSGAAVLELGCGTGAVGLLESTGDTGGLLSEPEQIKVNDYRRGMRALSESLSSRTKRVHPDLHALLERYVFFLKLRFNK